jgi:hypothetical protein
MRTWTLSTAVEAGTGIPAGGRPEIRPTGQPGNWTAAWPDIDERTGQQNREVITQ